MNQLKTKWGEELNIEKVHEEYPRPTLVRDSFFSLNGTWDYAIGTKDVPEKYDGTILVPFSPESELSGVNRQLMPDEYLHYRRYFTLPEHFIKERVLIHFGAVDQECEVTVNGKWIGSHKGGYLPFDFDITDALVSGENELLVCVRDMTEKAPHARGKQKLVKTGKMASIFYTASSGIWKTVWLESVPARYIKWLKLTPLFDECALDVEAVTSDGEGFFGPDEYHGSLERNPYPNMLHIQVYDQSGGIVYNGKMDKNAKDRRMKLPLLQPWTPESPVLYQIRIQYGRDVVMSYFGMRKFEKKQDADGIWRFYLNNKPFFFHGVLAQGYWPESLMTPPTDEALQYDITKMKALGFNTLRMHVKIESERFYYHCDRLGMVVWQDMPNGGGEYFMPLVTYLPNGIPPFGRLVKDKHYGWLARKDETGRMQYQKDLKNMVVFLYNHPSIALWTAFNEGWGQFDAHKASEIIRSEDKHRLINEACGWFDQKGGDVKGIHNYLRPLQIKPDKNRAIVLSECGGYACPVLGHMYSSLEFGYKNCKSEDELGVAYEELFKRDIYPNIEKGLGGVIYTQLNDIEDEINGILTYDRKICKFSKSRLNRVSDQLFRIFHELVKEPDGTGT